MSNTEDAAIPVPPEGYYVRGMLGFCLGDSHHPIGENGRMILIICLLRTFNEQGNFSTLSCL